MADYNANSIRMAVRLCEKQGWGYRKVTLVGSNFMSQVAYLQFLPPAQRRFAVLAEKNGQWSTFTLTGRERTLKNEKTHIDLEAAEKYHEEMVDTGIL
jgi:hypothetical protein